MSPPVPQVMVLDDQKRPLSTSHCCQVPATGVPFQYGSYTSVVKPQPVWTCSWYEASATAAPCAWYVQYERSVTELSGVPAIVWV
jgi:hypothetical protein